MRAADLLGLDGPLSRALPGYELRDSQLRMAAMVEEVLEHEGVALIEAGTGTGKTLAYLVPALRSGKKIVVSTGTRTLQDQIMESDLPALERHLGISFRTACMKGLSNYLCRRRYGELLSSPDAELPAMARRLPQIVDWVARTELADRAEIADMAEDDPIWAAVQSGPETRIGPRCSHFDECFVTKMRERAEKAQLIVVNHHLFFADLALRGPHGGGVLPDYDAVIFDEAHQVEDVATLFFGAHVSEQRLDALARDAERALLSVDDADRLVTTFLSRAQDFFAALPRTLDGGRIELKREIFRGPIGERYHALDASLEALELCAVREAGSAEAIAQLARRTAQVRDALARVADGAGTDVTYCESRGRRRAVGASPVDVSSIFRDEVVRRVPSVVLTSATLTTSRSA